MDKAAAYKIVQSYIHSISAKYNIKQAFLFGSYAKGNYHVDSDIDVAIVVDDVNDIIDTQIEMMKLRRKIDLRIEPHPFIKNDFNSSNPFACEIIKHGVVIDL